MITEDYSPKWLLEKILKNTDNPAKCMLFILEFQNELIKEMKQSEQLPDMTIEQAIEKAKPNMDKIKDVDKYLDDIR